MAIDLSSLPIDEPQGPGVSSVGLQSLNVRGARAFQPLETPTLPLDALSGAGVDLTKYVLRIVSGVLAVLFFGLIIEGTIFSWHTSEAYASVLSLVAPSSCANNSCGTIQAGTSYISESIEHIKARQDLLKTYLDTTKLAHEFWAQIAQMVLLNLLLPLLTALLGYVFASKSGTK